jgi:glucose-6-phosphate isomerase
VFSFVGLFPLAVLGVDITRLLRGATSMRDKCITKLSSNPAAMSAILQFMHYSMEGRNISDMFLFAKDLESLGRWYRQLMGESVGKEYDESGTQVFAGITPTVSIGSVDLHSVAQLYLGGPYDKYHTFVSCKWDNKVKVPNLKHFDRLVKNIQGRPFEEIMDAILQGVKKAFAKDSRPFCEVLLPDKSEESVGQFMQWKMCEMMYLGFLMGVNPFNQPNVESYKKETRKLLK